MENVIGIKKLQNGLYFTAIQEQARLLGYRVAPIEVRTWEYGVPQKRIRQLFIGTLTELPVFVPDQLIKKTHTLNFDDDSLLPITTLGEAIEDLPLLQAGDERIIQDYDLSLRAKYLIKYSGKFLTDVLKIDESEKLTLHCSRPHSERDLRDFARLREGETCSRALARGVEMEFPYDKSSFKDRYTRQSRDNLCSTIVAHLKSDGLMFIHPTQLRSLTPREAARVQTFPDTFSFSGSRSHAFTQIGNAVPPLIGRSIGLGILEFFTHSCKREQVSELTAIERFNLICVIEKFINDCLIRPIEFVDDMNLKDIWRKIHFILPHLHPESVLDNGKDISLMPNRSVSFCLEPYFIRSGWPVELAPIAIEARRRYINGAFTGFEYFHS